MISSHLDSCRKDADNMPNALVDVLIPAFNAATYLESAMNSVLTQTLQDIRVIVVDDGSTDETPEILAAFAARDDRVQVIRQDNAGIETALNNGLSACTADVVARFDADDICMPTRLADQLGYLDANPSCVAVDGWHWQIDGSGNRTGFHAPPEGPVTYDANSYPANEPYLTHPFLMVRRKQIVEIGGYRHVFRAQDADLYWRLSELGELHHISSIVGEYRNHPVSISNNSIFNGRISAVNSQLSALSYNRRIRKKSDIVFQPNLIYDYKDLSSLNEMIKLACNLLDSEEVEWYKAAVSVKIVQLSLFRSYVLDKSDTRYIVRQWKKLPPKVRRSLRRDKLRLARKFYRNRQWINLAILFRLAK